MTELNNSDRISMMLISILKKGFNVNILGATVNADVMPGAEQLAEIREIIDKVACVFSEPHLIDIINELLKI